MFPYDSTGVTVELREIVSSGVDIWDFDYPVPRSEIEYNGKTCRVDFDKEKFQQKILDHYWFRQIGQETVGRFLHYFRTRMREIMPYYVQVYEFDAKFRNIEDPLESYNLVETFQQIASGSGRVTGRNSSESSAQSTGNNNTVNAFSDTPQGRIENLDTHLTNANKATVNESASNNGSSSGNSEQDSESTGETSHTLTKRGNIGVQPLGGEVLNIRSAFINIDMQIIEELADLFLKIY